jgi:hypothetical protein
MENMGLGRDYLEITLRLRKLVPDWVEGYVGPADLAAEVDRSDTVTAAELRERVEALARTVETDEPAADRRAWLSAQLRAISTALLWLTGTKFDYPELFAICHGGHVERVPDRQFEEAHALLDRALPGSGDAQARYLVWREGQLVPRERLQEGLAVLAGEMRRRCREMFDLPEDEQVAWELVSGVPWAGNAEELGEGQTRVGINADLPISSARLLELVCHEAYPGHHTEGACKNTGLIRAAGRSELSVYVYPTPQALMSEGLACLALEALLGDDAEKIAAECLEPVGIPYDPVTAGGVRQAELLLLPVRSNIAMMLDRGSTSAEVREYAKTWLLDTPEHIDEAITNLEARSWRPYESCYPVGLALCRAYVNERPQRFNELLHRQLTPADLRGEKADARR